MRQNINFDIDFMDFLSFREIPLIHLASNRFINTYELLKFEDTVLIEVIPFNLKGYTLKVPIFNSDGKSLGEIVGNQFYPSQVIKGYNIQVQRERETWIAKLENNILFELKTGFCQSLAFSAELYTPDGFKIKISESPFPLLFNPVGDKMELKGMVMAGLDFETKQPGIYLDRNGRIVYGN
jgi:hypothetical protein